MASPPPDPSVPEASSITPAQPRNEAEPTAAASDRRPSPSPRKEITPAFQMKDVNTLVLTEARRSPSPGVITSRRGRSRSPVSSRPGSRADRSASADARSAASGAISSAAIAAGEAAAAAKRGPSPFGEYGRRSPSPGPRGPRCERRFERCDRRDESQPGTVNRWPSGSFECSPLYPNLSLGSFDWTNGVGVDAPPAPCADGHATSERRDHERRHRGDRHRGHHYERYPSPPPEMRYDPYYDERYGDPPPRHPEEYGRYYYDERYRYDHRYPRHEYRDEYRRDRHHRHDRHYHERYRSRDERSSSRGTVSQPLYSEHHILSTSSYREDPTRSTGRDAPTPTAGNVRRGSVFRGVTEHKSNIVPALRGLEESPGKEEAEGKKKRKSKGGGRGSKKKKKKDAAADSSLPEELMLGLDEESPTPSPEKRIESSPVHAPSPTTIDKELSAIGIDPLDGDYLGNLSFRKSYDLEQMFSFMKSPKGSMKEASGTGGMMDLKFGSMSFTNSFLMSGSGEEKNDESKNEPLKMRSHRRHPSSFGEPPAARRRSATRSPLFSGIPTIHTLTSQTSSLGLTPINSFSGDNNGPIVPLTSHDGMALRAFFASSPSNVPEAKDAPSDPAAARGPPPAYPEYSYRPHYLGRRDPPPPPPPPSAGAPPRGPVPVSNDLSLAPDDKRVKLMAGGIGARPVVDVAKRVDVFVLLKRLAPAFVGFQFKLPEAEKPLGGGYAENTCIPTDQQIVIATRRVSSSICAFGGCIPRRTVSFEADAEMTPTQVKDKEDRRLYEKDLSSRYFMKEHCISWDVELHEVIVPNKDSKVKTKSQEDSTSSAYCAPVTPSTPNNPLINSADGSGLREKGKKVKYRCKLCGQPKQNHTCTFQSTVMRSIGTMVYPAVNAFVSDEPGRLAPALSEMNNFTTLLSQDVSMSGSTRDYRPYSNNFNVLTPDSHWSPNTPGALSAISTPSTPGTTSIPTRKRDHLLMSRTMSGVSAAGGATGDDCLFRGTMELKPEQYRRVRFPYESMQDAFQYPHIPTPYSQRKEMGDTLFALSREVPKLADACAAILREARENDRWDQAVAELTTQVLIILKCEEQDYTLEGLKRHLLSLGIAC